VKAYKGFDKNMQCRGFQFKEGETYKHEGEVKCCESGFHSCENPLHVLQFYPAGASRFAEVEIDGKTEKENTKNVSEKISIKSEINLKALIELGFKFIFEKIKWGDSDTPQTHDNSSAAQTH